MCFTLAGFDVKTLSSPNGRWRMKVEVGESNRISDVHWITRSRFAKIAKREPIRGYDGGSLSDFDWIKCVEVDILAR